GPRGPPARRRCERRARPHQRRPAHPRAGLGGWDMRTAVLTISNRVSRREADDTSGELLARMAEEAGADVDAMEVLPDDLGLIEDRLHHFVDQAYDLILTTGGTGLTPDDVTPEATQLVIDREVPGFP